MALGTRFASVCIDHTNDQILYLGGGDHNYYSSGSGVFKSTNGGTSFSSIGLGGKIIVDLIMDPTNNQVLVAATNTGVYKTLDGGATWTLKTASLALDDMKAKASNGSRVLFVTTRGAEIYRSLDFGDTWSQITSGIYIPTGYTVGGGTRVAVTPADSNIVYFYMNAKGGTLFKSTDGGSNFTNVKDNLSPYLTGYTNNSADPGQGDYNTGLGVDGVDPNIVYFVLARLPDAPKGSKGISLFVVPKFLVNADGSLGERNGIYCGGLEHKMGIHGNATAQIVIDGAIGTLVGQPHKGMQAMFVMMNAARLGVGNQSLGLTEVAYQNALAYAKDRIQMRSLSGVKAKDKDADPIIVHPDVRKMLLTAKAYAEGGRALQIFCTLLLDKVHSHPDEKVRAESEEMVALLTPIVKAFITDNGHISTNACMQVFGGHGFIKEWGMEQFVRDNRINMIYEGTNTIQSLDLLGRKVLGNNGATLKRFGKLVGQLVAEEGVNEKMAEFINPVAYLGDQMTKFTTEIGFKGLQNPDEVGAAAVDYLRVAGHLVFGYFWARMAQVALREIAAGNTDPFYTAKLQTARFYFAKLFPETATLMRTARAGAAVLMNTDEALA